MRPLTALKLPKNSMTKNMSHVFIRYSPGYAALNLCCQPFSLEQK